MLRGTPYGQVALIAASAVTVIVFASSGWVNRIRPRHDISYGIYLWGFLVQQTVYHYLGHMYIGFHFFLSLLITVAMGYFSYIVVEMPAMKLGKRLNAAISGLKKPVKP